MNLPDNLLDKAWYWAAWAVWLPLFVRSVWWAPWLRLKNAELSNVWLGMIVLLTLLWSLKAGVKPGLSLHFLGATVFTLCFGPHLAFIGLSLVVLGITLNGAAGAGAYAANALLLGGGGVLISHGLYRGFLRILPRNFFGYIFVNGFFCSAVTIISVGFLACVILAGSGTYDWDYLFNEYFPYFLLLGFSEAWLSGMVMTLFVVYRPTWVVTFDDSRYLADK